jgi:integrase
MSLKGQKTKSDFIEWGTVNNLILKLERDKDQKFSLLIALGIYSGLRISDILSLTWSDVLDKDYLEIEEKKTKKFRKIFIHKTLKDIITRSYSIMGEKNIDQPIFLNRFGKKVITVQYVNRHLKDVMERYKISKNISVSTHSLRKSFGRRAFEVNNSSEKSLILLSEILNHSNVGTTKIYLGIREEEIGEVYQTL